MDFFELEVFVIAHQRGRFGVVAGYYVADGEVVVVAVVVAVGVVVALAASVAVCVSVTFHAPRSRVSAVAYGYCLVDDKQR